MDDISISAIFGNTDRLIAELTRDLNTVDANSLNNIISGIAMVNAAGSFQLETIQAMLDIGVPIDVRDTRGRTA
jgi:hypothetical protein